MSAIRPTAHRRTVALLAAGGLLTAGLTAVTTPSAAAPNGPRRLYVVQLDERPIAAYTGGVVGYSRTAPRPGAKVDVRSAAAQRYAAFLTRRQNRALARIGGERVVYRYRVALNGVAVRMSRRAADELRRAPGVTAVTRNRIQAVDTQRTPAFLGLNRRGGLWDQTGGRDGDAGRGTLVGIVDSGIWPESASFAGDGEPPSRFRGDCQPGERFPVTTCNDKLVAAKYFNESFPPSALAPGEFLSPRDGSGHGSHTASTAAGNFGVRARVEGINFGRISGMAPGAMIAAYKVCWNGDAGGCGTVDSLAAIDAAVADGVDVINYSISGSLANTFADPVENAFFNAASAGVFVATSAGNSGPGASTVAHNSPWVTTVAAGTHDRDGRGTVTLGDGTTYPGKSITAAAGPAPLVNSTSVGLAGASARDAQLCVAGALDPAQVAGKIVTCARGVTARIAKSRTVEAAGGVGMVLYNETPSSVNADLHFVPTVHVDEVAGAAIVAYADTAGSTASLSAGEIVVGVPAPDVADFSSRGPAAATGSDLLKPDLMAPGVDVLAAVAPPSNFDRDFDFYSGTSMSSPHVAGIGALLTDLHGGWSPAAIKSALMTSAAQGRNDGTPIAGTPFGFGSGQVVPNSAADPGLVYDAGREDWRSFAAGAGQCVVCGGPGNATPRDPSDLNYPSISIGALAGSQTVTRTVTNVSGRPLNLSAQVQAPPGHTVSVNPTALSLARGASGQFQVTITRTDAEFGQFRFGSLTWSGGGYDVRSPIAVRPVALAAPAAVSGTGPAGSQTWQVTAGYTGPLQARVDGLVPAVTNVGTHADGNQGVFNVSDPEASLSDPSVRAYTFDLAAGRTLARWSTFADASSAATDDIDLFVYRVGDGGARTLVGASATGTSDETVTLPGPAAGQYRVFVHNWDSDAATNDITLFAWVLDGSPAGNATVTAPASVSTGQTVDVTFGWSGLTAGTRYLGRVVYGDGAADRATTIVGVTG